MCEKNKRGFSTVMHQSSPPSVRPAAMFYRLNDCTCQIQNAGCHSQSQKGPIIKSGSRVPFTRQLFWVKTQNFSCILALCVHVN